MHLFEFDKTSFKVRLSEEALLLKPFKALFDKDKSRGKERALEEFGYMWFFADIKSPYQSIINEDERREEILKDINLPKNFKPSKELNEAIEFYIKRDKTAVRSLHTAAITAADAVNKTLADAAALIDASQDKLGSVEKVVRALEKVPKVMESLQSIEKAVIKEIEEKAGKFKGSKQFSVFEDGLSID